MTDTPRDQGDDLRERMAQVVRHTLNITAWVNTTDANSDAARDLAHAIADALLPVLTAHTDAALAEQREQIALSVERYAVTAADEAHAHWLNGNADAGGRSMRAAGALQLAARVVRATDIAREVGKP